ncbi:MAG: hypothetical protein Q9184_003073 [Pyrenodesmia sp. 2 TL-2023]
MAAAHHLGVDEFFIRLTFLFNSPRTGTKGTVYLTQKRCMRPHPAQLLPPSPIRLLIIYSAQDLRYIINVHHIVSPQSTTSSSPTTTTGTPDAPFPDLAPPSPLPVLIRASNGKSKPRRQDKVKISTIVQPDQLEGFFTRYAEVMRAGTTGLKKRDRSGRKKATKAKKKGKGAAGTGEAEKK